MSMSTENFMNKFANRMFRKAENIVWDLATGSIGVRTSEGIASLIGEGEFAQVSYNLFDQMSMEVPAFAQSTPVADVKAGDLIYFGNKSDRPGWVISKTEKKPKAGQAGEPVTVLNLMRTDGTTGPWIAPKTQMLGFGDTGVMVIRSLTNMLPGGQGDLGGIQNGLMQIMQMQMFMGGESSIDMESIMPMILMGQMGGAVGGATGGNNMVQTMLQMQMMKSMFGGGKGGKGGFKLGGGDSPFN